MVGLFHAAALFARDFLKQLFCRLRTVGLQRSPLCKKLISFEPDPAFAKKHIGTCCKNIIFTQVDSQKALPFFQNRIWKIEEQVEIPFPFFADQLSLFRNTLKKVGFLEWSELQGNLDPFFQSIQGYGFSFDRIGSFIEMDTSSLYGSSEQELLHQEGSIWPGKLCKQNRSHCRPFASPKGMQDEFLYRQACEALPYSNIDWQQHLQQSDYMRYGKLLAIAKADVLVSELCPIGC